MYRIERTHGNGFRDYLLALWEGDDLPMFAGIRRNPYLFDDKAVADRVAQRLAARFPVTMETKHFPAQPITYTVEEVSEHPHGQYAVYKMVVVDTKSESRGFVYTNWEAEPTIVSIKSTTLFGSCTMVATFNDGREKQLFSYYIDELSFSDEELIGKTEKQAHQLRRDRDIAYLRS